MIKANELRLGNYVYFENPHSDYVKIKISSNDFKNFERNNCFSNFEPIELTEEWLLRLGFKHVGNTSHFKCYEFENTVCKFCIDYGLTEKFFFNFHKRETFSSIRLEYVHQLQNLF